MSDEEDKLKSSTDDVASSSQPKNDDLFASKRIYTAESDKEAGKSDEQQIKIKINSNLEKTCPLKEDKPRDKVVLRLNSAPIEMEEEDFVDWKSRKICKISKNDKIICEKNCKILHIVECEIINEAINFLKEIDLNFLPNLLVIVIEVEEHWRKFKNELENVLNKNIFAKFNKINESLIIEVRNQNGENIFYIKSEEKPFESGKFQCLMDLNEEENASSLHSRIITNERPPLNEFLTLMSASNISFVDEDLSGIKSANFTIKALLKSAIHANSELTFKLANLFRLNITSVDVIELFDLAILLKNPRIHGLIFELYIPQKNSAIRSRMSKELSSRDSFDGPRVEMMIKSLFKKIVIQQEHVYQLIMLMKCPISDEDKEKIVQNAVEENNFKFLKIFLKFHPKLGLKFWQKMLKTAEICEFFEVIEVLLEDFVTSEVISEGENLKKNTEIQNYQAKLTAVKEFFENIRTGNRWKVQNFRKNHPFMKSPLIYVYYNETTALDYALEQKRYDIYAFLSADFKGKRTEEIIEKLSPNSKEKIRDSNFNFALKHEDDYILNILLKCRYQSDVETCKKETVEMLDILKRKPEIKFLLKILSNISDLEIIFDYRYKGVNKIDPTVDEGTLGLTYFKRNKIIIGKDTGRNDRYGTFCHEVTHCVMSHLYENKCLPYTKQNLKRMEEFDRVYDATKIIFEADEGNMDKIMRWCFNNYRGDSIDIKKAELIVRVPHLIGSYHDNEEKIEEFRRKFPELFEFFKQYVMEDLQTSEIVKFRNFNFESGVFKKMQESKITLKDVKFLRGIINRKKNIVVKSNSVKMTLQKIYNEILAEESNILQIYAKNLIVDLKKFESIIASDKFERFQKNFFELIHEGSVQRVIIDASSEHKLLHKSPHPKIFEKFQSRVRYFVIVEKDKFYPYRWLEKFEFEELSMRHTWMDLSEATQNILREKSIKFQGNLTKLGSLFDMENAVDILSDDVIDSILNSQSIEINSYQVKNTNFFLPRGLIGRVKNENADSMQNNLRGRSESIKSLKRRDRSLSLIKIRSNSCVARQNALKKSNSRKNSLVDQKSSVTTFELAPNAIIQATFEQKFVILSDYSGTGKSLFLRNYHKILTEEYPTTWVNIVNLQTHAKQFNDKNFKFENFEKFFTSKILNLKDPLEFAVFKNLYLQKKVIILFDKFVELDPECQQNFVKFAKSFRSHQIWISTLVQNQEQIEKEFEVLSYRLKPFTKTEQVEFIVESWKANNENKNFDYKSLREKSTILLEKIPPLRSNAIGMPLPISMIAELYKRQNSVPITLRLFDIFKKYIENKIDDEFDHDVSLECINILQFLALEKFSKKYEEAEEIFEREIKENENLKHKIAKIGIIQVDKDKNFTFKHEIFADFMIADFSRGRLERLTVQEIFFAFFIEILIKDGYSIVRTFLNDTIGEITSKKALKMCGISLEQLMIEKKEENCTIAKNLNILMKSSVEGHLEICLFLLRVLKFFKESIGKEEEQFDIVIYEEFHLVSLVINYRENGMHFLTNAIKSVSSYNQETFVEIMKELVSVLQMNEKDENEEVSDEDEPLSVYSSSKPIRNPISKANARVKTFKSSSATSRESLEKRVSELTTKNLDNRSSSRISDTSAFNFDTTKIAQINNVEAEQEIQIDLRSRKSSFVPQLSGTWTREHSNFFKKPQTKKNASMAELHRLNNDRNSSFEDFLAFNPGNQDQSKLFEFLSQQDNFGNTFLHHLTSENISAEVFEKIWRINTVEMSEFEVLKIIHIKNKEGQNFVQFGILNCGLNFQNLEVALEILKSSTDFTIRKNLITSKDKFDKNLLHLASQEDDQIFEVIFNFITTSNLLKELDIFKLICDEDDSGNSAFHEAAKFGSQKMIEKMCEKVKEIFQKTRITTKFNEIVEIISKKLPKDASEALKNAHESNLGKINFALKAFLNITGEFSLTTLHIALQNPKSDVFQYLFKLSVSLCRNKNEFREILKMKNVENCDFLSYVIINGSIENIKFLCAEIRQIFAKTELKVFFQTDDFNLNLLKMAIDENSMEIFKILFEFFKEFQEEEEMVKILSEKTIFGDNFMHMAVKNFTIDNLKLFWTFVGDFLENSSQKNDEYSIYANVMSSPQKEVKNSANLLEEIVESLPQNENQNLLLHYSPQGEVKHGEIQISPQNSSLFSSKGNSKSNLLQSAVLNPNHDVFEWIWSIFTQIFITSEDRKTFIEYKNENDENLLSYVFAFGNIEIANFFWNKIEKIYSENEIKSLLKLKGFQDRNLLVNSLTFNGQKNVLAFLWEIYRKYFPSNGDFRMIIYSSDRNGDKILHLTSQSNNKEILEFTWNKIGEILKGENERREFLLMLGNFHRNALKNSVMNEDDEVFEWMLKLNLSYLGNKKDKVQHILLEKDGKGENLLSLVFKFASITKINLIASEIVDNFEDHAMKELFMTKGCHGRNLIAHVTKNCSDLETVWHCWSLFEILFLKKSWKSATKNKILLNMVQEVDEFGMNFLHLIAENCNCEIFDFSWRKCENFLDQKSKMKSFLTSRGQKKQNLLHSALNNQDLCIFESILKILFQHLSKNEVKKMILEKNWEDDSLLDILRERGKFAKQKEILKKKIEENFNEKEKKLLKL